MEQTMKNYVYILLGLWMMTLYGCQPICTKKPFEYAFKDEYHVWFPKDTISGRAIQFVSTAGLTETFISRVQTHQYFWGYKKKCKDWRGLTDVYDYNPTFLDKNFVIGLRRGAEGHDFHFSMNQYTYAYNLEDNRNILIQTLIGDFMSKIRIIDSLTVSGKLFQPVIEIEAPDAEASGDMRYVVKAYVAQDTGLIRYILRNGEIWDRQF